MIKHLFMACATILVVCVTHAQVQNYGYKDNTFPYQANIGNGTSATTNPNAWLELGPKNNNSTRGILLPRGDKSLIQNPSVGLMMFDIPTQKCWVFANGQWEQIGGVVTWANLLGKPDLYTQTQINSFFAGLTTIYGYNKSDWDQVNQKQNNADTNTWDATKSWVAKPDNEFVLGSGTGLKSTQNMTYNNGLFSVKGTGLVGLEMYRPSYPNTAAPDRTGIIYGYNGGAHVIGYGVLDTVSPLRLTGLVVRPAVPNAYAVSIEAVRTDSTGTGSDTLLRSDKAISFWNGSNNAGMMTKKILLGSFSGGGSFYARGRITSDSLRYTTAAPATTAYVVVDTTTGTLYRTSTAPGGGGSGEYSLTVQPKGVGQKILYDSGDTLYHKTITGTNFINVSTGTDSTLSVKLDTASAGWKSYISANSGAPRATDSIRTGSAMPSTGNIYLDVVTNRLKYRVGNTVYTLAVSDSTELSSYDTDAQSYFNRVATAGVTMNTTQKDAINTFVTGLKSNSLWTKIYDAGLLVGGTAAAHAVTLKGVAPATVWTGTVTHSANGVDFDGSTGYGRLGIIPSSVLSLNNLHIALYATENADLISVDMGAANTGTVSRIRIATRLSGNYQFQLNDATASTVATANSQGFYLVNRAASTTKSPFKNGANLGNTSVTSIALPTVELYLGAENNGGTAVNYSSRNISYWSAGTAFATTAEVTTYNTLVEALQDSLGRGVQ